MRVGGVERTSRACLLGKKTQGEGGDAKGTDQAGLELRYGAMSMTAFCAELRDPNERKVLGQGQPRLHAGAARARSRA